MQLRKNYTGQKEFSLTLRKLGESPAKFLSDIISLSFVIRPKKNFHERKMFQNPKIVDTHIVRVIQNLHQLTILNTPSTLTVAKAQTFQSLQGNIPQYDTITGSN